MTTPTRVSEAESAVMRALWQRGEATAEELVEALAKPTGWQEATIKTLLNRLLKKRAIAAEKEGRRFRYRPLLSEEHWIMDESRSLLGRLFDGRVAPLVAHFSRHGALSKADVAELKRLVQQLEQDDHDERD